MSSYYNINIFSLNVFFRVVLIKELLFSPTIAVHRRLQRGGKNASHPKKLLPTQKIFKKFSFYLKWIKNRKKFFFLWKFFSNI